MKSILFARHLLVAIFAVAMLFASSVSAKTLGVFVINFDDETHHSAVRTLFQKQVEKLEYAVVIDAREQSLIGYYDRGDPAYNELKYIQDTIKDRYRGASREGAVNLARNLDFVGDVLKRFTGVADEIDLFLVNIMFHQDEQYRFSDGYPNDGFLFKNDNEFYYIDTVSTGKTRLHVLATSDTEFGPQYQRFFDHLGKKLFNAELATFSLATTAGAMAVDTKPTLDITPIDQGVSRSQVMGKERPPACPYEDRVVRNDKEDRVVELTVINPCRKNTQVSFHVTAGGSTKLENIQADDNGKAVLPLELKGGENKVALTGLDNVDREILKTNARAIDDHIEQTWEEGSVDLVGRNPLRRNGDLVTITHPESGRSWTVRVAEGAWRIKAPIQSGNQRFLVTRPDGGEPQVVDVEADRACEDRVEASQRDGTGTIRVNNPCRLNQGIIFRHKEESYRRQFTANGVAEVKISLDCQENEVFYTGNDGGDRVVRLTVDCSDLIKIILKWNAPVDLDLHVQEEEAVPGKKGWIYYKNMNHDSRGGIGELDIDDRGEHEGTKVENYKLKASRYPEGKLPGHFVVNFSRGINAKPPHCGDGELARIPYQVTVINRGRSETYPGQIESVPCGTSLPADPRLSGKQGPGDVMRPPVAVPGREPHPPPQPTTQPTTQPQQPPSPPPPSPRVLLVPDKAVTAVNQETVVAVLNNDTVPVGSVPQLVRQPEHGAIRVENGTVRYTPAAGYAGEDRFRYGVNDVTTEVQIWVAECPTQRMDQNQVARMTSEKLFACGVILLQSRKFDIGASLLRLAEQKGYGPAMVALGRLYDPNGGMPGGLVEANIAKAKEYYRRARDAGDLEAQSLLEAMGH